MERNKYFQLIEKEKEIFLLLNKRCQNILNEVKNIGDYFVNNIDAKNVDLYANLLKMKRLNNSVKNLINADVNLEVFYNKLNDLNMRLDKVVLDVETELNKINKKYKENQK